MRWSEVEGVWRRQEVRESGLAGAAALRRTFEAKSRQWARRLFWRDAREAVAGLMAAAAFVYFGWRGGMAGWPSLLCVLITLGFVAFFIRERLRVRRLHSGPDAPLLTKVTADIAELQHQRRLLLNVTRWYVAPLAGVCAILLGTTVWTHWQRFHTAAAALTLTGTVALVVVVFWSVRALNHRAVRRVLDPRLRELEQMRNDLLPPE